MGELTTKDPKIADEDGFEAKDFFYKYILSYWYMYVITIGLSILLSYYYNRYTTPIYKATCTVLIKDENHGTAKDLLSQIDDSYDQGGIENEMGILSSWTIINKTLQELNFEISYLLSGNIKTHELYKQSPITLEYESLNFKAYAIPIDLTVLDDKKFRISYAFKNDENNHKEEYLFGEPIKNKIGIFRIDKKENFNDSLYGNPSYEKRNLILIINSLDRLTDLYQKKLKIEGFSKKSTLLELSVQDPVPQKASDFLNKLTEVYLKSGVEQKNKLASHSLKFIDDQLALLSRQVDTSEQSVAAFKSNRGIADLTQEAFTILGTAKIFDDRIAEIDMQLSFLLYLERYLNEGKKLEQLSPASLGINDPLLQKLIAQLSDLQTQRDLQIQTAPEANPIISNLNIQIQNTQTVLLENIRSIKDGLKASRDEAASKLEAVEGRIKTLPGTERELLSLTRESTIKQALYTYLLQKRAETAILLASTVSDNRVVDAARTLYTPVKPVKNQTYVIGILLGFLLPAGFIYFKDILNDRIKDRIGLEKQTSIPILGMIGVSKNKTNLIINPKPESQISESFRSIRTNLQYFNPDRQHKKILITSSISSEGKSFIAANLSAIFALSGKKIVLVGADLRKPKKSNEFDLKKDVGISNYLIGSATFDEIIQKAENIPNLDIILSGPKPPNPSELIESDQMAVFFNQLSEKYDYVIIDSPPIGIVTDSMLLTRYADIIVYVVRQNVTCRHHLDFINELYFSGKLKNLCIILNALRSGRFGYGYGYGNGYGYGYNYFDEDDKSTSYFSKIMRWIKKDKSQQES